MATINGRPLDAKRAHELSLIASGDLRVRDMRVKTPHGYKSVKGIKRIGCGTYQLVT